MALFGWFGIGIYRRAFISLTATRSGSIIIVCRAISGEDSARGQGRLNNGNIMKTYSVKQADITRKWFVVDADGVVLGRLATELAKILRGKKKPIYSTHLDVGDNVIVINADKVVLTGDKGQKKVYRHHSGYPGGLKEITYDVLLKNKPEMVVEKAVRGMLPKNRLGRSMLSKLHVYAGPDHPHGTQNPEELSIQD